MLLFRRPYLAAILIHVALFATLARYTMPTRVAPESKTAAAQARSPQATAAKGDGFSATNGPFSSGDLQTRLNESFVAAQRLSADGQFGAAGEYARQLERISSVTSMKEIGAYLGAGIAPKPRQSLAEPGREKDFDHATSTPIGAKEVGSGQYVFVFKDANGNTCELPAAPGDETAARALTLLDRSEVLREFKNSVLLPALQQRLDPR